MRAFQKVHKHTRISKFNDKILRSVSMWLYIMYKKILYNVQTSQNEETSTMWNYDTVIIYVDWL